MEIGAVLKGTRVIEVPGAPILWVIVASLPNVCEVCEICIALFLFMYSLSLILGNDTLIITLQMT